VARTGLQRLARLLLQSANYGGESKPQPIIAKISQETLAEVVGTTRSRLSYRLIGANLITAR